MLTHRGWLSVISHLLGPKPLALRPFQMHALRMPVITPREHNGRSQHAGRPPFELVVSKLRRPSGRPGTVRRSRLIERLARGDPRPVVWVVAPAGYGKTTLLTQWAERNG